MILTNMVRISFWYPSSLNCFAQQNRFEARKASLMNRPVNSPTHTKTVIVQSELTDSKGRLKLDELCNFLQICAGEHAQQLGVGSQLREEMLVWVLSKMKLAIKELPLANQKISIETWPKGVDKLFALRDFKVRNEEGIELANATTSWLLINIENKRPRRADMVVSRFENHKVDALASTYEPISAPVTWSVQEPYSVAKADLDDNMHSNNVSYIRWFMDVLPSEMQAKAVANLEIHFLAETFLDNELLIKEYWDDQSSDEVLLEISRPKDSKVVVRAKIQML